MTQNNPCIICSKISFSDELKNKVQNKKIDGFAEYLVEKKIPGTEQTYAQYIISDTEYYDQVMDVSIF